MHIIRISMVAGVEGVVAAVALLKLLKASILHRNAFARTTVSYLLKSSLCSMLKKLIIHSIDITRTSDALQSDLLRLNGKSYPAYRDIEGKSPRGMLFSTLR